jgi:hypothetical protein
MYQIKIERPWDGTDFHHWVWGQKTQISRISSLSTHKTSVCALALLCQGFYCVSVRHITSFYRLLSGLTPPGLRHKIDIITVRNLQFSRHKRRQPLVCSGTMRWSFWAGVSGTLLWAGLSSAVATSLFVTMLQVTERLHSLLFTPFQLCVVIVLRLVLFSVEVLYTHNKAHLNLGL